MTPVETFWTVTAPKLAEKFPHLFKHKGDDTFSLIVNHTVVVALSRFFGAAPDLQQCHDIAEAIGVHVWTKWTGKNEYEWEGYSWTDQGRYAESRCVIRNCVSAPLACLAALNSAVEEVTK